MYSLNLKKSRFLATVLSQTIFSLTKFFGKKTVQIFIISNSEISIIRFTMECIFQVYLFRIMITDIIFYELKQTIV